MNIRQETANMIRELRNAGHRDLSRPAYNRPVMCENGQDREMIIYNDGGMNVSDFKQAIAVFPDDAIIDIAIKTDYDGYSDGIAISAYHPVKYGDVDYHGYIQAEYETTMSRGGNLIRVYMDGRAVFVDRDKLNSIL